MFINVSWRVGRAWETCLTMAPYRLVFSVCWTPWGPGLIKLSGEKRVCRRVRYLPSVTLLQLHVLLLLPKQDRHVPVPRSLLCRSSMRSVFSRVHRLIPLLPSRPFKVDLPHYPSTTFNFHSFLPLSSATHIPFLFCLA